MNRAVFVAAVAMVVVALVAGLAIVGGPSQGRSEKADAERRRDLLALRSYLVCKPGNGVLPTTLEDMAYCPERRAGLTFNDPVTDEPYLYKRLADDRFEVCARFEVAHRENVLRPSWRDVTFEGQVGCIAGRLGSS